MPHTIVLPAFAPDQPAARVDAALREALAACDCARECAVLWFAEVQRRALYREFGHASLELYATQGLGFSLNRYWQFKRLADDLERLPVLRDAVAAGRLGWTKAQQVARVATPETQAAWVTKAAETGRRELVREVQAARGVARAVARRAAAVDASGEAVTRHGTTADELPFAAPIAPLAPAQVEASITLRGDALQVARFEALVERARRLRPGAARSGRLDLVLEALAVLVEGATDAAGGGENRVRPCATQPSVQVVVQQCPDCAAATAVTARGELRLAPAQVAALACDARVRDARNEAPNRATIPPRVRAAVLARDRHRCVTPGCGATRFLEVHHVVARVRGGSNLAENLVTLCGRCHAFAHSEQGEGLAASERAGTCAGASGGPIAGAGAGALKAADGAASAGASNSDSCSNR
jgi:5-methylcytosine-specific restriction endonuclease McrA